MITLRKCEKCNYETLSTEYGNSKKNPRECKCGGLMKVVGEEMNRH